MQRAQTMHTRTLDHRTARRLDLRPAVSLQPLGLLAGNSEPLCDGRIHVISAERRIAIRREDVKNSTTQFQNRDIERPTPEIKTATFDFSPSRSSP